MGSAIGDAIGQLAFSYPGKEDLCSCVQGIRELRYTDDTAMAVGLAESMVQRGGVDQQHLGRVFSHNFSREPWRGYAPGPPTVFSMVEEKGMSYADAAISLFGGKGSLGNGAAMRIAPLGLLFHAAPDLYDQAASSAGVTHAHPVGMDGAAVQAMAVAQAVLLEPGEKFSVSTFVRHLIDFSRTPEIRSKMESLQELLLLDIPPVPAASRLGRSVAVHESVPFAIYAFCRHNASFEDCLFCAVLNGGDRDTLGAMACAVSGAYLGVEAIPASWKEKLENRVYIESLATALAGICRPR